MTRDPQRNGYLVWAVLIAATLLVVTALTMANILAGRPNPAPPAGARPEVATAQPVAPQAEAASPPAVVNRFPMLNLGMTKADVQNILGTGEEISASQFGTFTSSGVRWVNRDGSTILCVFQNDKLISKMLAPAHGSLTDR